MFIISGAIYSQLFNYKIKKLIFNIFRFFLVLSFIAILLSIAIFIYFYKNTPIPSKELMFSAPESSYILDKDGNLLYELHGDVKRTRIPLEQIPINLQKASIAIEDKHFYEHFGFQPSAMVRAAIINFRYGEIRQGASTITQQLARTILLNNEVSYERKIKEVVLAIKIEREFTKDEILELYLNNIPYGSNAYGVVAASEIYFNKKVSDLSLLESAYLAALPKAPSDYSPFGPNVNLLHKRAKTVLNAMYHNDYIKEDELNIALNQDLINFQPIPVNIEAPHFVFYVIDYLEKIYGQEKLRTGGFNIYTTLDLNLQKEAEEIITKIGDENEKKFGAGNAALVAISPKSGEVLAMIGSRDYFSSDDGAVNVTTRLRQPGSSFKPYIYAAAMENGLSPASMLFDVRTDFASSNNGVSYIPRNYSGRHYGPVSLRQALAGSLNVPAVKALVLTGIDKAIDTAENLGISSLKDRSRFGPSLVLGSAEVTLLEHTAGLGTLGNLGIKKEINPILKIEDKNGSSIYTREEDNGRQVIDPQIAYLMNNILSDKNARRFVFGNGERLLVPGHEVAAKTGTTQDYRDAWTIGYTPSIAVGVWSGNNDNSSMKEGANGYSVAAPIWKAFMERALALKEAESFVIPEGIVEVVVDSVSGKLPTKYSLSTKKEVFASFNTPTERDSIRTPVKTAQADIVVSKFQSEKPDDPLWEQGVIKWSEVAGYYKPENIEEDKKNIPVVFSVPQTIRDSNWEIHISTDFDQEVSLVELFLNDQLITRNSSGFINYGNKGKIFEADNYHFSAKIYTKTGDVFTVNKEAIFLPLDITENSKQASSNQKNIN